MKQIHLNCVHHSPFSSSDLYTIYFHSSLVFKFSNRRKAERFQLKLNAYIEDYIHTLNHHLVYSYSMLRELHCLLSYFQSNYYLKSIRTIEHLIDRTYIESTNPQNGAPFVYSNITSCFSECIDLFRSLESICRYKKYYHTVKQLRAARRSLIYDSDNFEQFNVTETLDRDRLESRHVKLNAI